MAKDVKVDIVGDASKYKRALGEAETATGKFGGNVKTLMAAAGAAFAVDKILAFGADAVKAAAEDEKGQRTLAEQLKRTTGATDKQVASIEKFITKTQNATGVLDDQLRPALGQLVRATGNVDKAQGLLGLTLDISAATGRDAESVALALGKAYQGNIGGLQRLGISMKGANGESLSFAEAQKQLNQQFGGAAAVAADTAEGKYRVMQARFSDLKEEIGAKLLPVLSGLAEFMSTTLIPGVEKVVQWFTDNWPKIKDTIVAVFEAVKPYLEAVVQVFKGIFEAIYGTFQVFKGLFTGDWHLMWQGIADFVGGIKNVIVGAVKALWESVQLVGEVIWAAIGGGVTKAWNGIKDAIIFPIMEVKVILQGVWDTIASAAGIAWNALKSVIEPIVRAIVAIIETILTPIQKVVDAFNAMKNLVNGEPALVHAVSSTQNPAPAPRGLRTGQSATGGMEGGRTLVGEHGPEVVDLPAGSTVHTAAASTGMLGGGSPMNVTVNVNAGIGTDGKAVGLQIHEELLKIVRQYRVKNPWG